MKPMNNRTKNQKRDWEEELYERRAGICKAFAHPVRLKILDLVAKRTRPVSELHRRTGKQVHCFLAIPEVKEACALISDVLRAQVKNGRRLGV
jgi:DNA-binding transcriptional ArsR family regulator